MAHRHKWQVDGDYCGASWMSCECGGFMDNGEMERRINAVERLPLQSALQIAWDLEHAAGVAVGDEYEALQDYVAELEG